MFRLEIRYGEVETAFGYSDEFRTSRSARSVSRIIASQKSPRTRVDNYNICRLNYEIVPNAPILL